MGLLAYELLSGQSPFGGVSPRETMANQLTRTPPSLEKLNPEVPAAQLARIIARSLEKDPERRFANADEMLHALEDVGTGATGYRRRATGTRAWGIAALTTVAAFAVWALSPSSPSPVACRPGFLARRPAARRHSRDSAVTVTVTPAPLQLTREDSLAIARAVEGRRSSAGSPSWSQAQIDSLKVQLERAMAESLGKVIAELREPERRDPARGYTVRRFEFTTPPRMPEGARLLEPAAAAGASWWRSSFRSASTVRPIRPCTTR